MVGPLDQEELDSVNDAVVFNGLAASPEAPIRLEAQDADGTWQWLDDAESASYSIGSAWGSSGYHWSHTMVLPDWAWRREGSEVVATTRAVIAGVSAATFEVYPYDCYLSTVDQGMWVFLDECASANPSATVRVELGPLTQGKTDCSYGDEHCSVCVADVNGDFSRPQIDISDNDWGFMLDDLTEQGDEWLFGGYHFQGIARLSDVVEGGTRTGRVVLTENLGSGLHYLEHSMVDSGGDAVFEDNYLGEQYNLDIRDRNEHPGGVQAHGDVVAIAMEDGPATSAAVDFYRFSPGEDGSLLNRLVLDGSRGEPDQEPGGSGASAAGFITLSDGHILVAAAGKNHGARGIWFYKSREPGLDEDTEWRFLNYWTPELGADLDGEHLTDSRYFGGASGLALLSDCWGNITMITMNGEDQRYHWFQRFVLRETSPGKVEPLLRAQQRDRVWGAATGNKASFRWGAGLYISEDGTPVMMNTERRSGWDDDDVEGHLFWP